MVAFNSIFFKPFCIYFVAAFERLTTAPTTPYDRLTSTAAYERRAVFDRAYEAAAYDRRLYALTGGIGGSYYAVSNQDTEAERDYPESFQACLHIAPCLCRTSASPMAWLPSNPEHLSKLTTADAFEDQPKCQEPEHPLDLSPDKSNPDSLPQDPITLSQDPLLLCDTSQENQTLLSGTSQNCKPHSSGRVTCKLTSADTLPIDQPECQEPWECPLDHSIATARMDDVPQDLSLSQDPLFPSDSSQDHETFSNTSLRSRNTQNCISRSADGVTCKLNSADALPIDQPKCQEPWECPSDHSIAKARMDDVPQDLGLSQDPLFPSDSSQEHETFNDTSLRSSNTQNCISHSADGVTCKLTSADALLKDQPNCHEDPLNLFHGKSYPDSVLRDPDRLSQDPLYPSDSSQCSAKENIDPLMSSSQNQAKNLSLLSKPSQKRTDVLTSPLKPIHPENFECLRVQLKPFKNVLCRKKLRFLRSDDRESSEDLSSAQDPLSPSDIRQNLLHTSCEDYNASGKRPLSPELTSDPVRLRELSRIVKPCQAWSNQSGSIYNRPSSLGNQLNRSCPPQDQLNQSSWFRNLPKRSRVACQDSHLPVMPKEN